MQLLSRQNRVLLDDGASYRQCRIVARCFRRERRRLAMSMLLTMTMLMMTVRWRFWLQQIASLMRATTTQLIVDIVDFVGFIDCVEYVTIVRAAVSRRQRRRRRLHQQLLMRHSRPCAQTTDDVELLEQFDAVFELHSTQFLKIDSIKRLQKKRNATKLASFSGNVFDIERTRSRREMVPID
jgi:hypothetical protein